MNELELPPQHPGQARTMLICEGPKMVRAEVGHWYSPEKVAELIAAEREACAKVLRDKHNELASRSYPPPKILLELEASILGRSNTRIQRPGTGPLE